MLKVRKAGRDRETSWLQEAFEREQIPTETLFFHIAKPIENFKGGEGEKDFE